MGDERRLEIIRSAHRQNALGREFIATPSAACFLQSLLGASLHETSWRQFFIALAALDWIRGEPRLGLGLRLRQGFVELRMDHDWLTNRSKTRRLTVFGSVMGLSVLLEVVVGPLVRDQGHDVVDAHCLLHWTGGGRKVYGGLTEAHINMVLTFVLWAVGGRVEFNVRVIVRIHYTVWRRTHVIGHNR